MLKKIIIGKLEFLGLKWAVTSKFSDYLRYGPPFTVYTDNNHLTYILPTAKLNAVGLRWVAELADFKFVIKYRPGRVNVDADYLSRNAMNIDELIERCIEVCQPNIIKSVMSSTLTRPEIISNMSVDNLRLQSEDLNVIDQTALVTSQKNDDVTGPVYNAVLMGCRPKKAEWKTLKAGSKLLMQQFKKLKIENSLLVRNTLKSKQIVLPRTFHNIYNI